MNKLVREGGKKELEVMEEMREREVNYAFWMIALQWMAGKV